MKYGAGSSSSEWSEEQGLVKRSEQGAGDQDIVPFRHSQSKARINTSMLLPAEATHTQGKAVTLL